MTLRNVCCNNNCATYISIVYIDSPEQLTLEFLINEGLRLLIFGKFSSPYALIKDPTFIWFWQSESSKVRLWSDPTQIWCSQHAVKGCLCYFVSLLYFENILFPFEKCFYTYQRIQLLVILTSLRLFTFFGNLPPYDYSRTLRLLILSRNSSPYAYSIPHVY